MNRESDTTAVARLTPWLEAAALFLLAAAVRAPGLTAGALHDELYTFLAARGLAEHGSLTLVPDGSPYTRAALYSRLVAGFLDVFGPTLVAGRLPALIAGCLTAVALFLWLRLAGERLPAWIAGGMVALDPLLIQLSQVARFYALQQLSFLLGCILTYAALTSRRTRAYRVAFGVGAAGAFALAVHLQPVSMVGLGGVAVFLLGAAGVRFVAGLRDGRTPDPRLLWIIPLAAVALLVVTTQTSWIPRAMGLATYADLWALRQADNPRFYYAVLHDNYSVAWSLLPLLAVFAAFRASRLALMSLTIFAAAFLVHSFLAWKAPRYISYLLPLFFAVSGLGVARALPPLRALVARQVDRLPSSNQLAAALTLGLTLAILGFATVGNRAYLKTARLLTRDQSFVFPLSHPEDGPLSWQRFAEAYSDSITPGMVVVSTDDLKAIHYLGRVDYAVSPSHLYQRGGVRPEFSLDRRVNAGVISSPASISAIMACSEEGLFVAQTMSLGPGPTGRGAVAAQVEAAADSLPVDPRWGIVAYRWRTRPDSLRADCDVLAPRMDLRGRSLESGEEDPT